MYDDILLNDWTELKYRGRDLEEMARKTKMSVADLRQRLDIPYTEVGLLTTTRELKDAYQVLPDGKEKNEVEKRMDNYCLKKLETAPKDMTGFFEIRSIFVLSFMGSKSEKKAVDWLIKIGRDFLKKATIDEIGEVRHVIQTAEEIKNEELLKQANLIYFKLSQELSKKNMNDFLKVIEETEDLKALVDLKQISLCYGLVFNLFEKQERRCIEEAKKAEENRDYERAKEVYFLCPDSQKNHRFAESEAKKIAFDVWKKICLESEDEEAILKHLRKEDYDDGESDSSTISPEAESILDEIFVGKIELAKTKNEVEMLIKKAPSGGWFKSRSAKLGDEKMRKMLMDEIENASEEELIELCNSKQATYEIQKVILKKIFQ